jgi:hypothetical protein
MVSEACRNRIKGVGESARGVTERTSTHQVKSRVDFEKRYTAGYLALGVDHPLWRTIETGAPVVSFINTATL